MAAPRAGRRGRPEGYRKPWRADPDRHIIGMASGLGHAIEIDTQTAIRLAALCHYHEPIQFAARMARRLDLRPKVLRKVEDGWHLDVFKEHPGNKTDPHGSYLKGEARRVIRQWHRWHGDTEFETWRAHMTFVWVAMLCANQSPVTGITVVDEGNTIAALKRDVAARCSWLGENIYANLILIPLINQAFRSNS